MNHQKAIILALISVIVALAPAIAIAASPIISVDSYTTYVGSSVTVPIEITTASAVAGGSVEITFNPSIVNVQEVLSGDFGAPIANINNTAGFMYIALAGHEAVGKGEAILASIRFKGISKGITMLDIQDADLNDEAGAPITPAPETSDGEINVLTSSDADSDSDTDSHSGDGYADSIADADAADDDSEKEEEKVSSNEPTAINIGSYSVYENSDITVSVEITHASAVAGGSANITFNSLFVNVEEVLPGDFGTPIANINNDAGFVYIACASPTAAGKGKAKLASLRFKGISKGLTSLDIQDATLNDERGKLITLETTSGGEIEVRTPIPPPEFTPSPFATTNESITTPPPAPGEHDSLFVITIVIIVCVALAGGAIALYRKRKKNGGVK
ncbi:MAG TPA: hypothetical protein C5S37_01645 [Methanophagales archaeon]|nr:hypothetical protein [Methanophagales archaeon]